MIIQKNNRLINMPSISFASQRERTSSTGGSLGGGGRGGGLLSFYIFVTQGQTKHAHENRLCQPKRTVN